MPLSRLDPSPHAVAASVDIAASPERVFRALTDPEELAAWWVTAGPIGEAGSTHDWRVDARPGGEWSAKTTDAAGREATVRGEYRVVDPPRVLELTWEASWEGFVTTTVRIELEPIAVGGTAGTRVRVTHTAAREATACAAGALPGVTASATWTGVVMSLARHAAGAPAPTAAAPTVDVYRPWAPGDALPHRGVQVAARPRGFQVVA